MLDLKNHLKTETETLIETTMLMLPNNNNSRKLKYRNNWFWRRIQWSQRLWTFQILWIFIKTIWINNWKNHRVKSSSNSSIKGNRYSPHLGPIFLAKKKKHSRVTSYVMHFGAFGPMITNATSTLKWKKNC